MNQKDRNEAVGRVVLQSQDELSNLVTLQSRAGEIGEKLIELGQALVDDPQSVTFDGRDFKPVDPKTKQRDFPSSLLDSKRIEELCSEIRSASRRHVRLLGEKEKLGIT